MESEQNSWLGLGHHKLRVVGGYWSRRNTDLRDPFAFPSGMENRREPCSRSDDNFCGDVRRSVSDLAHGPRMDGIFRSSLSQHERSALGELQLAFVMGRVRDLNILHRFIVVLVFRFVA